MKFQVTTVGFDMSSGQAKLLDMTRGELIDTEENEVFADCTTPEEVARRMEAYWNALNRLIFGRKDAPDGFSSFHRPSEVVKVLKVVPV